MDGRRPTACLPTVIARVSIPPASLQFIGPQDSNYWSSTRVSIPPVPHHTGMPKAS